MPRPRQPKNTPRARQLRRDMTLPEVLLWNLLRRSPDGVSFRRQHSLGPFVLDFYCPQAKCAFEIDGIAHDMGNQPQRDEARTAWLEQQGITVVRIAASEVLKSAQDVAEGIVLRCKR